ncbi:MAG: arginine--tRNA ligase [Candidatus Micrarchaeota archaeon]|nr:arginine--tRNA ligase [Candidatus Micrarchaeota archaeon]
MDLKEEFVSILKEAISKGFPGSGIGDEEILLSLSVPKPENGDISSSISFRIAKTEKKNPKEIAERLASGVKGARFITKTAALNGYINSSIDEKEYAAHVLGSIKKQKGSYVRSGLGKGTKVIVESPSVNPNKPWHIGHLRNALLGDSISNMMEACSYKVEREDYIDDLGMQVAESYWGYTNISDKPDKKFDTWLGEQYVEVNKRLQDKAIEEQVRKTLERMEEGSSKEAKEARKLAEECVRAQYQTAGDYSVYHDVLVWESDIVRAKLLDKAFSILTKSGVVKKDTSEKYKDCIIVDLERIKQVAKDFESPNEDVKVLIRSNGTATYVAKDIAFHMWKFGLLEDPFSYGTFMEGQGNGKPLYTTSEFGKRMGFAGVSMAVNVIDNRQRYLQLILKSMFMLMGRKDISDSIMHLSYGKVDVEGGTLSGREGGWMGSGRNYTADSLLAETEKKVIEIVENSEKISNKENAKAIARAVAIGAIKFEFLKIAPEKNITFSWERALKFEGNTGPYCMYTYARASKIIEGQEVGMLKDMDHMSRSDDLELVKLLGMAPEMLEKACSEYRTNIVTDYLIELCTAFSRFYETMPVLKGGGAKELRLALVDSTAEVLKETLMLLGIAVVKSM